MTDDERLSLIEYLKDRVRCSRDRSKAEQLALITKFQVQQKELEPLDKSVEMGQFLLRVIQHADTETLDRLVGKDA